MGMILRHLMAFLFLGFVQAEPQPQTSAFPQKESRSFEGHWIAPSPGNEEMHLIEEGPRVSGEYRFISSESIRYEGRIEAVRQGAELRGKWQEHPLNRPAESRMGPMFLELSSDGMTLKGWYEHGEGPTRTDWIMRRK